MKKKILIVAADYYADISNGLIDNAKKTASVLGYNYPNSIWYERSYKVFNKKYKPKKIDKKKELGFLRRKIKELFE